MTNMDLHDDETSNSVFNNSYPRSEGELKVGDMFLTKEEFVLAIKKFHMNNSADFTMKRTDSRRYVIECRNMLCKFLLAASYKKKDDSWEIASIDPPHSCIATNVEQDHRKLSAALICQDILPLVNKDPSVKVSIIISHLTRKPGLRGQRLLNRYSTTGRIHTRNCHGFYGH